MNITDIGLHAGVVWRTLHGSEKEMTVEALMKTTNLGVVEVAAAIGWLARENKIIIKENEGGYLLTVYRECYY